MIQRIILIACVYAMLVCLGGPVASAAIPLVETIDMNGSGDNADDMCVWLHPTDSSKSVILGCNKSEDGNGGIYSFALDGGRSDGVSSWGVDNWFDQGEKINNVDVRYNFQAGAEKWDIVVGSNRTDDQIDIFRVDTDINGDFDGLTGVGSISTGSDVDLGPTDNPYGMALFHSKSQDKHYAIASSYNGEVAQWELSYNAGAITGAKVWHASVSGSEIEGIVADDEKEVVYIAAENTAIYRYQTTNGVIQDAGRVTVDSVIGEPGSSGAMTDDIEGITLYYASDGKGYLIASSQGSDQFAVYDREFTGSGANDHVMNFSIGANGGIDAVSDTDGIDVSSANLGGSFDDGMFLAHDASNTGGSISNIKLVDWADVADETVPNLITDTTWDPRSVPEPTTMSLLALAGFGVLVRHRRRA